MVALCLKLSDNPITKFVPKKNFNVKGDATAKSPNFEFLSLFFGQ